MAWRGGSHLVILPLGKELAETQKGRQESSSSYSAGEKKPKDSPGRKKD